MAKADLRGAAERLERGIERYGDGDLVAAAVEFEEALRLAPEHARARQYLSWVKDVLAGTRGNGRKKDLDEDAVRAVTEALDAGEEAEEAPWNPVPLTPNPAERQPSSPMNTIPYGLEEAIAARSATELAVPIQQPSLLTPITPFRATDPQPPSHQPHHPQTAAPPAPAPQAPAEPPVRTAATLTRAPKLPETAPEAPDPAPEKHPSSSTILGMAPPREGILRPAVSLVPPLVEESVTREFNRGSSPTLHNLPPLDVPELTEEQVAELISLESTLPTTGPGGRQLAPSDLATTPDLPTEQRPSFIEFEAEATPLPHRNPTTTSQRREPAEPQHNLHPLPDFDPMDMTPTHMLARGGDDPRINPLPVDEQPLHDDPSAEEVTQNPTNPFISKRLADYADELTSVPTGRVTTPKPSIADIMGQAKRVLAGGDPQTALDIADDVVTAAGGVDSEACMPFLTLLEKIYGSVIGSPDNVPRHGGNVPDLDPRAAFMLSRIDGSLTVDDLLEISGMPRLEAMRVLALLIRHGAVVTR